MAGLDLATDSARRCLCSCSAVLHPSDSHPGQGSSDAGAYAGLCKLCASLEAFCSSVESTPDEGSASRRSSIGADDEKSDDEEGSWILADDLPMLARGTAGIPRTSQSEHGSHTEADNPGDAAARRDRACCFDDGDVEYLSSDSDLNWDAAPFDYEIPFERPLRREVYGFEVRHPRAAPVIRALLRLPAARQAQQMGGTVANHVQALQDRIADAYHGGASGAEQAAQAAQNIVHEAGQAREAVAHQVWRRGHDVYRRVWQHWPNVVRAMGDDGWLGRVAELMQEGAAAMALEQHGRLARGRRR